MCLKVWLHRRRCQVLVLFWGMAVLLITAAQAQPTRLHQFSPGQWGRLEELPASRFRMQLERLSKSGRLRALAWLRTFHFTEKDLTAMRVDPEGGIYYVDHFQFEPSLEEPALATPRALSAPPSLSASPFPTNLIFHSRPGAPHVLYLNFTGENVTNTAWNTTLRREIIPALGFSIDSDFSRFSHSEQLAIKRIWQRVAEDYAPFEIDVTTERPALFGRRTAHALITRNTDANGELNSEASAGGIAYVNMFGTADYAKYRPAWIYYNNLGNKESYIAEAVSHEIGHNMGLSHDGRTDGVEYYKGHGSGDISWGPIMGSCWGRNVSQWSKGDYYLANNTQDDLAILSRKLSLRGDDHAGEFPSATALRITEGANVLVTIPNYDPANTQPHNKGILESSADIDMFSFVTGAGEINLSVNPMIVPSGATYGGNLDVVADLFNQAGQLLLTVDLPDATHATIQTNLAEGLYYLRVRNSGAGHPTHSIPSGYTAYGSIGQYFIAGSVAASLITNTFPSEVLLATSVNRPDWGAVSPAPGHHPAGSPVEIKAIPAPHFRFAGWRGGASGATNPLSLVLNTNLEVQAIFAEILTTNHPTPCWWLAEQGMTSHLESAVSRIGANGLPLWQSYIAGLDPDDPNSQLRLLVTHDVQKANWVLNWNTVTGRVYSIWWSTNLRHGFSPLAGAANLPASVQSFTHTFDPHCPNVLYQLKVEKP